MKQFGRSLLNPVPGSILSTFATETSTGEPTSNATAFSSERMERKGDSTVGWGDFCLLDSNEQAYRRTDANRDITLGSERIAKASAHAGRS